MDLPSIVASSPDRLRRKSQRPRVIDLVQMVESASRHSKVVLAVRNQTIVVEPASRKSKVTMDQKQLNALVINAIEEVSALTSRHATVRIEFTKQEIVIRGQNPLDLPDSELTLDRVLKLRAWPLQIKPMLRWDRALGPVLTLSLPTQKPAASVQRNIQIDFNRQPLQRCSAR